MRKFSELSNNDPKVETSTDKKDYIKNLVEEALTVEDGEIVGKDTLVKTLNKIIEMNDSKTKIQVLESVKVNAYRGGFDFNLISQAIELERQKLNDPVVEEAEEQGEIFFAQPNTTIVSMSESVDNTEIDEETTEEEVIEEAVKGDDGEVEDPADEDTAEEENEEVDKVKKEVEEGEEDESEVTESIEESIEETEEEVVEEVVEEADEQREIFFAQPNTTIVSMSESVNTEEVEEETTEEEVIEEKKKECDEECDDDEECKDKEECDEECDDDKVKEAYETLVDGLTDEELEGMEKMENKDNRYKFSDGREVEIHPNGRIEIEETEEDRQKWRDGEKIEERFPWNETEEVIEESVEEEVEEVEETEEEVEEVIEESVEEEVIEESVENDSAVEEVSLIITSEMQEISDLAGLCENILNEDHLNTKKEKIEYILDNSDLDKEEGTKKKEELENMSDTELDTAYKQCEKDCSE